MFSCIRIKTWLTLDRDTINISCKIKVGFARLLKDGRPEMFLEIVKWEGAYFFLEY